MKDISVIIPVYNGEQTIERTIASLISNIDYIKEIIIVDDYSNDNTLSVVNKYYGFLNGIKIIKSQSYHNPGIARKTGMLKAKGKYITFVDADDCLTASSLKYVSNNLYDDTLLLCCKTIYYESGNFNSDTIAFSDTSCGGNFYNREFLINNKLYPDNELKLVEDEYFNEKVIKYIELHNGEIKHFDYPVYEVHHDISECLSYALSNWIDYLCKYRLLYKEKITIDFISIADKHELKNEYINNLIFCYFLAEGLMLDEDVDFVFDENKRYFGRAISSYERLFDDSYLSIINYFENNTYYVAELLKSAISSIGFEFEDYLIFRRFILDCL